MSESWHDRKAGGRGKGEVAQPAKKRRTDEKEKLGKVERCD